MQTKYYSIYTNRIVKKTWLLLFLLFASSIFFAANLKAQTLIDNYDASGTLTYTTEGSWLENGGVYEGKTGGLTTPEHSYASYDLSTSFPSYDLGKANENTWFGWIDLNRTSVSGWGASSYSAGMVLAANSSDFNDAATNGYAVVLNSTENLDLIIFGAGIVGGTESLPSSSILTSSGYTYSDSDNGVNFFVEYLSDGTWKIYYLAGAQLSDADAIYKENYTGGNAISSADETYSGTSYIHAGWIYAHNTGASEKAYFDNFGAGFGDELPPFSTWNPANGDIGIPVSGDITITFNEAIRNTDGSSLSGDVSSLITSFKDASLADYTDFSASISGNVITITYGSTTPLDFGIEYTVTLAAIEDSNGNETSGESISFTAIGEEPTNHVSGINSIAISHKQITTTWGDNQTPTSATGLLLLIKRDTDPNPPVDGTETIDDLDISDGEGAYNIGLGIETYTWENLDPDQGYNIFIYPYTGSGDNTNYKLTPAPSQSSGTTSSTPNASSIIRKPENQIAAATINSITNAEGGTAKDVFRFTVVDTTDTYYPNNDSYSTYITNIRVRPNRTNTTDWSDHIQSVNLYNNRLSSSITIDSQDISDTLIDISILKPNLEISDNDSVTITLSVFLNASNTINDGEILSFYIDDEGHGFVADEYGSTFTTDPLTAEVVSNDFTIDVDATKLVFNSIPSGININTDFTAEVWATDANNNLDIDDVSNITLTDISSNGDISSALSTLLTEDLITGIYTWTDIQYDYAEGFTITATDNAASNPLDPITSGTITAYGANIATPGSVIISEIMVNPSGTEPDREWLELYNANTFPVDLNGWSITDAGTNSISVSVSTSIAANGFYTFGKNDTPASNGNYDADFDYSASTFLLDNDIDEIIIDNGSFEITRVEYDNTNGWTITNGSSLIFTGTASDDNNDASLWATSSVCENGYLDDAGDNGSPGTNGFQQDLISATTWSGTGSWSQGNLGGTLLAATNNWSNGVPGSSADVTVNGTLTVDVSTPAACNDLTISSGNTLTINAGKALTVYGNTANNNGSASGLYLDADATSVSSLITMGFVTGDATVISYFTDLAKYYIISSPISNALGAVFTGDVVYAYNEPAYTWDNPTNLDYAFGVGIGYAIYKNSNTATYAGTLNTGAIPNTLTYADASNTNPVDGWNLMGNPYPSVLDISYLDYTDISNGVWVNLHNSASDYYVYWSKTLGTVGSSGEGGGDDRARYIQPGQGFWIYTDVDGTAFNLSNSMRTHQNQGVFSKSAEANTDTFDEILKISVSGNDITDPAYILFRSNATLDFDRDYDLLKMTSSGATVPHIFSLTGEDHSQRLAINAIAKPQSETVVPLGLKIGTDGTYRLYFDGMNSFEETQDFYLRDRLNGELFDIRLQPMIEFNHLTSNPEHRFDLVMGLQTDINNPIGISLPAEVYSFRNTLYIRPAENQKIKNIEVKNLLGQTVYSSTFTNSFKTGIQMNLPTAFYLVEIQFESGSYSKKIFIQNLN